jgi:hypothetical protein
LTCARATQVQRGPSAAFTRHLNPPNQSFPMTPFLIAFLALMGLAMAGLGVRIGSLSTRQRTRSAALKRRRVREVLSVLGIGLALAVLVNVARGWSVLVAALLVPSVLFLGIRAWQRQTPK